METWETLTMSRKEVPRAGLLKAALAGKISNAQGALAMHVRLRQFQRAKVRFATEGAGGLLHRLRGRPSPRRLAVEVRARAAELLQGTYAGLNDCHLTEKLQEVAGLPLSRSSVRRLRRTLGLPATRRRRGRQVRMRRTPEAQMGALVQLDASPFAWFEGRGPVLALHGAIDDATGTGLALYFRPAEDRHGYATLLRPAPGSLRRSPRCLRAQRSALDPRGRVAGDAGPDPLRAHPAGARHWLHRRPLPTSQGPHRTLLANPARSPRQRAALARDLHVGGGQRLPAGVPRRPQPPLRPRSRRRGRGL